MTGLRSFADTAVVQTFKYRQSSPVGGVPAAFGPPGGPPCVQRAPYSMAGRMPDQWATGCGARQRLPPVGGAAYGMPLKTRISGLVPAVPATTPASSLMGSGKAACEMAAGGTTASTAAHSRLFMVSPQPLAPAESTTAPAQKPLSFVRLCSFLVERVADVKSARCAIARRSRGLLLEQQRHYQVFLVVQVAGDSQAQPARRGDELLRGQRGRCAARVRVAVR